MLEDFSLSNHLNLTKLNQKCQNYFAIKRFDWFLSVMRKLLTNEITLVLSWIVIKKLLFSKWNIKILFSFIPENNFFGFYIVEFGSI